MTLDFEHYLKVKIINDSQENPSVWSIVEMLGFSDFINFNAYHFAKDVLGYYCKKV